MKYFYRYWLLVVTALCPVIFWLQPSRFHCAALAVFAWLSLCLPWLLNSLKRSHSQPLDNQQICIAYASQGGQAQSLAQRSAEQLQQAGIACQVRNLSELKPHDWKNLRQLLLIASTYGEGEAPDQAAASKRQLKQLSGSLPQLDYAVLALGDRQYSHFCAFGRWLDQRLSQLGANALYDCLNADRCDPAVLRQWQQQLAQLAGGATFSDWQAPSYQNARLLERQCLNPDSQGNPAFLISLLIPANCDWQAGDVLEVAPCNSAGQIAAFALQHGLNTQQIMADGENLSWHLARRQLDCSLAREPLDAQQLIEQLPVLAHRDYSIASLPQQGKLQLLVRLHKHASGVGCASGWLCKHAEIGSELQVRVRANPNFQLPAQAKQLILIGNGTGIAGLHAHLLKRLQLGQHGHWLLFGERQAAHDHFFADEQQQWLEQGHLSRLDLAFSRDQAQRIYVQQLLRDAAQELRLRIEQGAYILLCGSLKGMGEEVDALLHGLLGAEQLQQLRDSGRYRRDLY